MSEQTVKTIAILNASAPFSSNSGKDALDLSLIFASYEQPLSIFFHGDGVYQLINNQSAKSIDAKDYLKTFSAFEFYDIENVYVCETSLQKRSLPINFHIENVQILSPHNFAEKLAQHSIVFRF